MKIGFECSRVKTAVQQGFDDVQLHSEIALSHRLPTLSERIDHPCYRQLRSCSADAATAAAVATSNKRREQRTLSALWTPFPYCHSDAIYAYESRNSSSLPLRLSV